MPVRSSEAGEFGFVVDGCGAPVLRDDDREMRLSCAPGAARKVVADLRDQAVASAVHGDEPKRGRVRFNLKKETT